MRLTTKKKVRGAKRKSVIMVREIKSWTEEFPEVDLEYGYWHIHMPFAQTFIDSTKTPSSVRRLCIQTLINQVEYLINIKPKLDLSVRVVAAINLPSLSDSQIIIFFGDKHYNSFFDRSDEFQRWISLPKERNIVREWQLKISENMKIKGYKEEIFDENSKSISELWFIGELN
jgi:hypothetical protein